MVGERVRDACDHREGVVVAVLRWADMVVLRDARGRESYVPMSDAVPQDGGTTRLPPHVDSPSYLRYT